MNLLISDDISTYQSPFDPDYTISICDQQYRSACDFCKEEIR